MLRVIGNTGCIHRRPCRPSRWLVTLALLALGGPAAMAGETVFSSTEQAVAALAAAWHHGSTADLVKIFGAAGDKLVSSGDPVAERLGREKLAQSFDHWHMIDYQGAAKAVLVIGDHHWPYPIPLVKQAKGWRFDVRAGAEQIVDRRIGRDELNAIKVCRAYVEAQHDFAHLARLAGGQADYAQVMASSPGRHNGLYWPAAEGTEESPLGPFVAAAEAQGYQEANAEGRAPFHGYYFRILTRQGATAAGGAKDYIRNGHMTEGFALVAFPAKWGNSGVMTFLINQDGIVYEKNLGPNSAAIGRQMTEFKPDTSWKIVTP